MRDLTKAELEEYFRFAGSDKGAHDFHMDQARLIGEVVIDFRLFEAATAKLLMTAPDEYDLNDFLLSFWVAAFQMGRECESRLITAALKGSVAKG
jgi:hypothetical protein